MSLQQPEAQALAGALCSALGAGALLGMRNTVRLGYAFACQVANSIVGVVVR